MTDSPELPDLDDEGFPAPPAKYDNWPSAEGYVVPADFRPTPAVPVPAMRCTGIKDDGTQCKKFAVRGTGVKSGRPVCMVHGAQLPNVRKAADAYVASVRMRLIQDAGLAADTLFDLMENSSADSVRLKAATEVLDRAGLKGAPDISVEVEHKVSPVEDIRNRLANIAKRIENPVNLGAVIPGETVDEDPGTEEPEELQD